MKNIQDVMINLAKAVRIALRRQKQRVIVLPTRVIEVTEASKSNFNPTSLLKVISGLSFDDFTIEDLQFKKMPLTLPFGQKSFMLGFTVVIEHSTQAGPTPDNQEITTHMVNITCSPDLGAIEVSLVS